MSQPGSQQVELDDLEGCAKLRARLDELDFRSAAFAAGRDELLGQQAALGKVRAGWAKRPAVRFYPGAPLVHGACITICHALPRPCTNRLQAKQEAEERLHAERLTHRKELEQLRDRIRALEGQVCAATHACSSFIRRGCPPKARSLDGLPRLLHVHMHAFAPSNTCQARTLGRTAVGLSLCRVHCFHARLRAHQPQL
jgi:hypothetical protein